MSLICIDRDKVEIGGVSSLCVVVGKGYNWRNFGKKRRLSAAFSFWQIGKG